MLRSLLITFALASAFLHAAPVPPTVSSCGGTINWSNTSFSPLQPIAGALVSLSALGSATASVVGGSGNVTAFLWGAPVFEGLITAIGLNQSLDIEGIVALTFNGLPQAVVAGDAAAISFSIVVPGIAEGMGTIGVIINATDGSEDSALAFCLNLTVTF